jgi:hypothetical protein
MSTELARQRGIVIEPITPLLDGFKFDPETKRIMGIAFEMICAALKYTNRPDIAHEALANRTIELARNGVLDPDRLCERVLNDLRKLPPLRTNMLAFVFVVVSRPAHSTTLV